MDGVRAFPQSLEAERALLGGLLQRPDLLLGISEVVKPSDFYRKDHAELFSLLVEMQGAGEAIDLVTVPDRVARNENPGRFGGVAYVTELPDHAPSTSNLAHYAGTIRHKAILRTLIARSQELADEAYAQPDDVTTLLDKAAQSMLTLGLEREKAAWHPISLVIDDELKRIEEIEASDDGVTGIPTGFIDLDQKLAGLHAGDLVVLAARPSMGKTALALNIAQNAALLGGVGVGIYSLEMGREQLVDRMLSTMAEVDASRLRTGRLAQDDWAKLLDASDRLRYAPIYINDRPGLTVAEVRAHSRRLKSERPDLGLLVVDYLQLMQAEDPRQSRVQQVSDMSRGLKALAKELRVPVLALSQLSRNVEARQDKRPLMSDLRESGAIEQDADIVLFIYRDEYYNPDTVDRGVAEVIVAKHRNGPTGAVKLLFQSQFTRFDNPDRDVLL